VYCWDLDNGFAACILIKKTQDQSKKGQPMRGSWDSIHVVEINNSNPKTAHYKLTSTVMLTIETQTATAGQVNLSGSLTRQTETDYATSDQNSHVSNLGRMVEDMESKLRTTLEQIYFGKTKDIAFELRTVRASSENAAREQMQRQIGAQLNRG